MIRRNTRRTHMCAWPKGPAGFRWAAQHRHATDLPGHRRIKLHKTGENRMAEMTGRCLCGEVRWSSPGPVLWAGHCHCQSCRRATSAPMTSFFGVPRESVTWTGTLAEHLTSGGRVRRQFCATCGSQMTYQNQIWPTETHLYAACLDDPAQFTPQAHYHWAERVSWLSLADDLPKFPGSATATEQG